jgi:hypothetical protein
MKIFILIFVCSLAFNIIGLSQAEKRPVKISSENIKRYISILADDSLEGRGNGQAGGEAAAKYLAEEFEKLKLKKAGSNNSYYQNIPMHGSIPQPSSELILYSGEEQDHLTLYEDYLLYKSGAQTFIPVPLELVFVGYGIIAPEYDYNDYQSVDVVGKIVVFLEGEPYSKDENYFDGERPTIYAYPEAKQRIAISRGASGSILIPDLRYKSWEQLVREFSFEDVTLALSVSGNLSLLVNPSIADSLFKDSGFTLKDIYKMYSSNTVTSFSLKTKLSFKGYFKERDFLSPNIVGILEGGDPELKDSYLLISAHYDHLGIGPVVKGDSIYNGTFDNAVGVAALLEIARIFTAEHHPRRSIIFILLTGEEKGLLGSIFYISNPVKPLYKTIANVNIDGIALFDNFTSIIGIGKEFSTLEEYLNKVAEENDLNVTIIPSFFEQGEPFYRSDQAAFAAAGIPSIMVVDGIDYKNLSREEALERFINYSKNIYHSPFDDLNQPMNFNAAVQHINFIYKFCNELANSDDVPEWKKGSPFINVRLRSIAEKK